MGEPLVTFGHGTARPDEIVRLLRQAGVRELVDIRIAPGSRHNPQASRAELERWLPGHGIGYRWEKRLGGRRRPRPDSPDTALRERGFAGYAAHMRSPEFLAAVDELLRGAGQARTAIMCAESVWWRCHRRMVADFLVLARGTPVLHLYHDGRLAPHRPCDLARVRGDGLLVYDAGQPVLWDGIEE
ncbi:DNA repair protein [Carbonactinospora thermoautotrophica]|uniref:DNA repair protein n=3 Tax=Carbonactinospora thermoautotrophica TaxID=1469144 RepID=A0A132MWH5_9ACTN|nr:DUF488 domain-containing protein [Carbonactinospora thermoautotrophica]KWX02096.1 Uncharacterized protein LI90_3135 [Carbonactinospora thermoautotrophica]KWX03338.1 DNA repair protein [Carbonactinospora thermoautotrophica]